MGRWSHYHLLNFRIGKPRRFVWVPLFNDPKSQRLCMLTPGGLKKTTRYDSIAAIVPRSSRREVQDLFTDIVRTWYIIIEGALVVTVFLSL